MDDATAKQLRAPLPITASSHAIPSRSDDETHEQLSRSTEQARITKTRAEASQDVSFLFLQARMAGTRRSILERMLMKKDDERNLHFASCPPEVQTVPRERDETCRMGKVDKFQRSCYPDR